MKSLLILLLITSFFISLNAMSEIETLAEDKCGKCHLMGLVTKEKIENIEAPPYWGMSKKVKNAFPKRADQINFIVDYSLNPSEEKMLFPIETRDRFGIMPSLKGKATADEIKQISEYFLNK